jgi:hypothetical protein
MIRADALVLTAVLTLTPLHSRPAVPPVGAEVDQAFEIPLPAAIAGPAVHVSANGATLSISRTLLEQIAAKARTSWSTEAERQELIAGGRATALLAAAQDATGVAPALRADALADAGYLVAQILEAGQAVVTPEGATAPTGRIVVRYVGTHPGPLAGMGHIAFSLQSPQRVFFTISWFCS